jgi:sodium transport system permease protein
MMTWWPVWVVFAKEVRDNMRDRRSLFLALAYPFIGPLLLGALMSFVGSAMRPDVSGPMPIAVDGAHRAPALMRHLRDSGLYIMPSPRDPFEAVKLGRADYVLLVPEGFDTDLGAEKPAELEIIINATRLSTVMAVARVAQTLREYGNTLGNDRLKARGIDPTIAEAVKIQTVNVGQSRSLAGFFLNMMPPFIIFTIFIGGVYLAIDTTAGERERGSMEPLLTNPISRGNLMLGKLGAALLFTVAALVFQLVAFKAMFEVVMGENYGLAYNPSIGVFALMTGILLPLVVAAVALQVIVATVSRSYKETQTYLGLLPLLPSLPGMLLVFVPLKAHAWMMAIPTFGQILLVGALVRGEPVDSLHLAVSLASTTLLAAGLLWLAARLYERDQLLFGG